MNKKEISEIFYKASKIAEKRAAILEGAENVENYNRAALCRDLFAFLYLAAIDN